ncbi:MAG: hypothetical protein HY921_11985 [Elusimicrobia bacterium]|nr:hypothetical protein [Elusimicrobiota bacterium]
MPHVLLPIVLALAAFGHAQTRTLFDDKIAGKAFDSAPEVPPRLFAGSWQLEAEVEAIMEPNGPQTFVDPGGLKDKSGRSRRLVLKADETGSLWVNINKSTLSDDGYRIAVRVLGPKPEYIPVRDRDPRTLTLLLHFSDSWAYGGYGYDRYCECRLPRPGRMICKVRLGHDPDYKQLFYWSLRKIAFN